MSGVIMALAGKVYPALTASIGAGASNAGSGPSFGWGANTCTAGGGSGSYSYSWHVSGSGYSLSTPLSSSTSVSISGADFGVEEDGAVTCTVTDTVTMRTVTSNTASYAYTWNSF